MLKVLVLLTLEGLDVVEESDTQILLQVSVAHFIS